MKSNNNASLDSANADKQNNLNPLARLDVAMDKFIKVAEDFMIRTSYQTDKQTSKEIALLKNKWRLATSFAQEQKQKLVEIKKGYAFLSAQLDDLIQELDDMVSKESGERSND